MSLPVAASLVMLPLIAASGYKTITRNTEWKDNTSLFITDAKKVPNSIKANVSAATQFISLADLTVDDTAKDTLLRQAIVHLHKAIEIQVQGGIPLNEQFPDVYLNLGSVYYRLGDYPAAADNYLTVEGGHSWFRQNAASVVEAFRLAAAEVTRLKEHKKAEKYLLRALSYAPNDVDLNYRLGGAYYLQGDLAKAKASYEKCTALAPDNPELWLNLGGFYFTIHEYANAVNAFERCLALQPGNVQAQQGLAASRTAAGG
jgi:tetratricopeptide (TPR) repeat protein